MYVIVMKVNKVVIYHKGLIEFQSNHKFKKF